MVINPMTAANNGMTFFTNNIVCRLISTEDETQYNQLYTDKKIMRKIGPALSEEQAKSQFQRVLKFNQSFLNGEPPRFLSWGIFSHQGEFLGAQGLLWNKEQTEAVEMGIMLCQTSSGKGLAVEGIGSLIDFALKHMNLKQFEAHFAPTNRAVERFVLKLGFTVQGSLKTHEGKPTKYCYIDKHMWQHSPNPVTSHVVQNNSERS